MKNFTLWDDKKTKPNKANMPALGRKSETQNPKQDERVCFEKTKPICRVAKWT
jgi:hypothetical protein